MTNERYRLLSAVAALLLILTLFAGGVRADGPSRAGLVVRFGDGHVFKQCVEFGEDHISGLEVLLRSGMEVVYEQSGLGATVCKVEGDGCAYPSEPCFCRCPGGPACTYWSYWHLKDGTWEYSRAGASGYPVRDGDVEGWTWGPGTAGGGPEPPVTEFDGICAPPATATPTHTPTRTATPTYTLPPSPTSTSTLPPTAEPTDARPPTDTPVPSTPVVAFRARPETLTLGECAELRWDVEQAQAIYLDGQGVVGHQVQQVCPEQTQSYELLVISAAGEFRWHVTVAVVQPSLTPLPTGTPAAVARGTDIPLPQTQSPTPMAAGRPTDTPPPARRTPTSMATGLPSATPLLMPTPLPMVRPGMQPTAIPPSHALAAKPPMDPTAEVAGTQATERRHRPPGASASLEALWWPAFVGLLALLGLVYVRWRLGERG